MLREFKVAWPGGEVTARFLAESATGILIAHGAGTDQNHPSMVSMRDGLAEQGFTVMTFNYPYTERGSKRPDRAERLIECHRAAAEVLAEEVDHLFLAGRSMGGRIGTYVVAEGFDAAGLILYAYPLHPAGKPEKLRIDQFSDIEIPMLFLQGTKDAMSRMELFEEHIAPLPRADVELLEGAGHGFRGGGWNLDSIVERYVAATKSWIDGLRSGRRDG